MNHAPGYEPWMDQDVRLVKDARGQTKVERVQGSHSIDPGSPNGDQTAIVIFDASPEPEYLTIAQWSARFTWPKSRIYVELGKLRMQPCDLWYGPESDKWGRLKENDKRITDDGTALLGEDNLGRQKSVTYYRLDFIEIINERLRVREENRQRALDLDHELRARLTHVTRGPIVPIPTGRRIRF